MGVQVLRQIEAIYYPILAAVGVPVNLVAIVILSRGKCGLSKCITHYLVAMAVADLLVVVTHVILTSIVEMYFPLSFLNITSVCSLNTVLLCAATVASVWLTVGFTFDRFVVICCQKLKTKYCTEKTAAVVIGVVSVLSCSISLPRYFTFDPEYIMDNVPRGCAMKPTFFNSPSWAAFDYFELTLTPCVPLFLMLVFNSLTVRYILVASRVRRALRGCSNGENHKDPEMENRRKSIVLLFSISGSFILLWSTELVYFVSLHVSRATDYMTIELESVAFMLQLLSSCTNTCIYAVTQTNFREELKNAVKYPLSLIVKLMKS